MADLTGANLGELTTLASDFLTTGGEIQTSANELFTEVNTAVGNFLQTVGEMQTQTSELTEQMRLEMDGLVSQADGVSWEGQNRQNFNTGVAQFKSAVNTGCSSMDDDITTVKTDVESKFNPVLEDFAKSMQNFGTDFSEVASSMNKSVVNQRDALDQVANVGWTNA